MKVAIGKVVGRKVEVEGEPLEEGATGTVVVPDETDSFEVTPEDKAELLARIEAVQRRDVATPEELFNSLSES